MTLEELNNLEAPLLKELVRHEAKLNESLDDRSYNGIKLISDGMYSDILNNLYKPYANALLEYIEAKKSEDIADLLELKLEKIRIIHYDQENRRLEVDSKLKELKSQREYISENMHKKPELGNLMHDVNGLVDSWWRYSGMLNLQLGYINRLSRIYATGKAFQEADLSIPVLSEYEPSHYEENMRWQGNIRQLLMLIQFLQKLNHITGLSTISLNKLISFFTFPNDDISGRLEFSDYTLEFTSNDNKVQWISKNVDFAEVYWWLVTNSYVEHHGIQRLTALVRSILEVVAFKEISPETKNPVDSLRRTIEQFEKNKIIRQELPDTPLKKSLAKLFKSE